MIEIFYLDGKLKKAKNLKDITNKEAWIDITNLTENEAEQLKDFFKLHPLTAEDLLSPIARIKVEEFQEYLFCVFYGIMKSKESIELVELDFVLGKNYLVSNHKKPIKSFSELKSNDKKIEALLKKGPEYMMHKLLDKEVDNYFPVLEDFDEKIEKIEEEVIRSPSTEHLTQILKLKRLIVIIKRHVFQQREKISFLAKNEYGLIGKKARYYFRDVYDHAIRVADSIDNYREAISEAFDAYMSATSNKMNEVMKVLSIIATIALPMTVISGIYGTNFLNLPGSRLFYGFWVMISIMVLFSISMLFFFRKRGWF